ncbi:hypothetical protein ACFQVC_16595 [Streptomyces monticola]|uniref:Gram-positive cocci surface proteins LPxTG domain-containing protein n=1 Tax=Streptomyces monticola TaxID=2666263 RepID=A0ABW2JJ85_9ACTN
MRATRRTLRTSVIAAGVVAGIAAMPVATAFADSPVPTPSPTQSQNQNKDQNKEKEQEKQRTSEPQGRQLVNTVNLLDGWSAKIFKTAGKGYDAELYKGGGLQAKIGQGSSKVTGYTFTLSADGKVSGVKDKDGNDKPVPGGWVNKGWTDLGDGWKAEVQVNASARSAKAYIQKAKMHDGNLAANGKTASTKIAGYTFTLTIDGKITKSGKGDDNNNDNQRTFVREYKNLGGSGFDAKVYKVKGGYDAEMWAKDPASGKYIKWDTLQQRGNKPAYGQHNGAHFVLNPDGTMKGWTEGGKKKNENKGGKDFQKGKVVPKGGVKAGAETAPEDNTAMLAAGGGMAAAGAAGLGFAMLRRGRREN